MTPPTEPQRLVLFDIDGTLIATGGAGRRAMRRTFADLWGLAVDSEALERPGRTDWLVVQEVLGGASVAGARDREEFARFTSRYCEHLQQELTKPGSGRKGVLAGVAPLLASLASCRLATVALLTGNVAQAAKLKLSYFDLWPYFAWGVFGDEARERDDLLPIARERYESRTGRSIAAEDIVVVGDTPHDVRCARRWGARAVAVATGAYDAAALRACDADVVLDSLDIESAVLLRS